MIIQPPNDKYRSNSHFVFNCKYHIIFCPKYRRNILTTEIQIRLKEILNDVANKHNSEIIEIETMPNHIHLILDCDPSYGPAKIIREMKGISSKLLRNEFQHLKTQLPCLWTRSSFISTVGSVSLEIVKQYIENQKGK